MSCAFTGCMDVETCCLVGGCVNQRFQRYYKPQPADELKANAPALNGTKAARTVRDPRVIKRKRKALRP